MAGHFYIEGQRITSKLGSGNGADTRNNKAGGKEVNYPGKQERVQEGIVRNLKFLGQDGAILTAGKSGKVPPGQIIGGGKGNNGGGQNKDKENFMYFFHPDHLGSSSFITDASGEVYQHLEYFAFGETFVEEHSNTDRTPYLFNGKELDEETGLYYYGARYYDPKTSVWQSVDPLAEQMPSWSAYNFVFNNPIMYFDPDGRRPTNGGGDKPIIIKRTEWGARAPIIGPGRSYQKIDKPLNSYYNTIVIHHAGNNNSYPTMRQVQNEHMDGSAEKADIGYHFGIDRFGNIYEGRPIDVVGAHVDKANTGKIGIVLLGDFDSEDSGLSIFENLFEFSDDKLTSKMENSLLRLVQSLIDDYGIEYVGGHKDVNCERHCPGKEGQEAAKKVREKTKTYLPVGETGN